MKYTRELLAPIVAASISFSEVARTLGIMPNGGGATHLANRIRNFDLDTSHFLGRKACKHPKHRRNSNYRKSSEILIRRTPFQGREKSYILVRSMVEMGVEYRCIECGLGTMWNDKELTLEVDHIDADPLNNLIENLRFLCPNCHSQTPTHSLGKRAPARKRVLNNESADRVKQATAPFCAVCGKEIAKGSKHCLSCAARIREATITRERVYKIDWPSNDELRKMVEEKSYLAVGQALGVSDNAIRKRLKRKK